MSNLNTREALELLWESLDSDIFLVLDTDGSNPEQGQYRKAGDGAETVRIYPDAENSADEFWGHVANAGDAPSEIMRFLSCNGYSDEEWVTPDRAEYLERWCKSAPGFSDGPEFARDALIFD